MTEIQSHKELVELLKVLELFFFLLKLSLRQNEVKMSSVRLYTEQNARFGH